MGGGNGAKEPIAVRLYRKLLALLPVDFRDRFGEEAAELFGELYAEARRERGWTGAVGVWIGSVGQVVLCAVGVRRERSIERSERDGTWLDRVGQDLRFGVRSLMRHPRYSLASIGTLALGLGASVTIFSVIDTVLLRPLPYAEADRLLMIEMH